MKNKYRYLLITPILYLIYLLIGIALIVYITISYQDLWLSFGVGFLTGLVAFNFINACTTNYRLYKKSIIMSEVFKKLEKDIGSIVEDLFGKNDIDSVTDASDE